MIELEIRDEPLERPLVEYLSMNAMTVDQF